MVLVENMSFRAYMYKPLELMSVERLVVFLLLFVSLFISSSKTPAPCTHRRSTRPFSTVDTKGSFDGSTSWKTKKYFFRIYYETNGTASVSGCFSIDRSSDRIPGCTYYLNIILKYI